MRSYLAETVRLIERFDAFEILAHSKSTPGFRYTAKCWHGGVRRVTRPSLSSATLTTPAPSPEASATPCA
ncbi:hypothetical protein FAIPA1_10134 [Frankia sp. AiPs1]